MILLTHALAEYAYRYYEHYNGLIPALNKAGYSVYSFDLRGHGNSPGDPYALDATEQVHDNLTARWALKAKFPDLPLYLFAHSAGCVFAAKSVFEDQSGLSGVIMTSPGLTAGQNFSKVVQSLIPVVSRLIPKASVTPLVTEGLTRIPAELDAYLNDPQMRIGNISMKTGASILRTTQQMMPRYSEWVVPTLIIYGTDDRVSDMHGLPKLFDSMGSADKTIHPVPGGYHELLNDLDRDKVLFLILNWLEARKTTALENEIRLNSQLTVGSNEQLERLRKLKEKRGLTS